MKESTQIYCHACEGYFTVEFDMDLSGNHVVSCPKCKHEHCRVIRNGKVTGDRWDRRNGQTYTYSSTISTYTTSSLSNSADSFLAQSWVSTTGSSCTACAYIF